MTKRTKVALAGTVTLKQAAGEAAGPTSFDAVAYSGDLIPPGVAQSPRLDLPYVIDLKGVKPSSNVKVNLDHEESQRVGHVTEIVNDKKTLAVSGVLSA